VSLFVCGDLGLGEGAVLYLGGPVTGTSDYVQRFRYMYNFIKRRTRYEVLRSAGLLPANLSWEASLHISKAMVDICDAVVFMFGFRDSRGCRVEFLHARAIGKSCYEIRVVDDEGSPEGRGIKFVPVVDVWWEGGI